MAKQIISFEEVEIVSDNARLIPIIRDLPNGKMIPMIVSSKAYKECKTMLVADIARQLGRYKPMKYNIDVGIRAWTYKDITNIAKVVIDALEEAKVIENDRDILHCDLIKIPTKRGRADTIEIIVTGDYDDVDNV